MDKSFYSPLLAKNSQSEEKLRAKHTEHSCYGGMTEKNNNKMKTKSKIFK